MTKAVFKTVATYAILPAAAITVLASSIPGIFKFKREEEHPHLPHQEYSSISAKQFYLTSIQVSAAVVGKLIKD